MRSISKVASVCATTRGPFRWRPTTHRSLTRPTLPSVPAEVPPMVNAPRSAECAHHEAVETVTPALLRAWPLPLDPDGDKHSRGSVLVIGGSARTAGAVLLSAIAALRAGAGR